MAESGRSRALDTAKQYVSQDRNARHGDPEDNFETIAKMWNAYGERRGWEAIFTRADVAMLCILLKAARAANDPTYLDNYVDIIGYGACAYEVAENANQRGVELDDAISSDQPEPPAWVPGEVIQVHDPNPASAEEVAEALNIPVSMVPWLDVDLPKAGGYDPHTRYPWHWEWDPDQGMYLRTPDEDQDKSSGKDSGS